MKYIGVDGCPDGWLTIEYGDTQLQRAAQYDDIEAIWDDHHDAEQILIDVPIGLREEDNTPRPCDAAAREYLGSPRSSSVFPTPIRPVLGAGSYEEARKIQEAKTGGSVGAQTWGISDKILELDEFMQNNQSEVEGTVREAHPEVCYCALNGDEATAHSKTGAPIAAYWERIDILEKVDGEILEDIRRAGTGLDCAATNDDLLDAFVLAVTGSPLTETAKSLPGKWPDGDDGNPTGLPMEMVFAEPHP